MTKPVKQTDHAEQSVIQIAAHDPDRLLCVYFMPKSVRFLACCVLAFRCELLRALAPRRSENIAGAMAAYVRLQWWREVLEGTRLPEHTLAPFLVEAIEQGCLSREALLQQITSIESEIEGSDNNNDKDSNKAHWRAMLRHGAGAFQRSMGELLGLNPNNTAHTPFLQRLEWVGMAYAAGSLIRHNAHLKEQGRYLYPGSLEELRQEAQQWLKESDISTLPRYLRAATLPAVLARKDLARGTQQREEQTRNLTRNSRGIGDQWAVIYAGVHNQVINQITRPLIGLKNRSFDVTKER